MAVVPVFHLAESRMVNMVSNITRWFMLEAVFDKGVEKKYLRFHIFREYLSVPYVVISSFFRLFFLFLGSFASACKNPL